MSDFTFIDLLSIKGMTEARLAHLIKKFKEPDVIFNLSYNELVYEQEIEHELAERLVDYRRDNRTRDAISKCQDLGVKVVTFLDDEYPDGLKNITQAPPVLFIRGTYQECDACAIALIGTRRATTYGRTVTDKFAREFCAAGVTVISGLARGIDTQAHMSALAEGGRTIAVMGTGIDRIYPPENQRLAERIVKSGALFTD
ncbi:MAG: DNA-processing protein DprA, partial [candidate division WOR-3 bacterium]